MLLHFLALSHKTHPPFLCPYPPLHLFIWPCTELYSWNFFFPFACAWHASQDFLCQPPLWCCCDFKLGTFVVTTMLLIFKQQSPALTRAWVVVTHGQLAFLPVKLASTPTQCVRSCKTYSLSSQIFSVHGASLSPWPYHPLSPGSKLRVNQSLAGTAFVFVVSCGCIRLESAAFTPRTGVQVSLSSVSCFSHLVCTLRLDYSA